MLRVAIFAAALLLGAASVASAQPALVPLPPQPADTPWPNVDWPEGQLANDVDEATLDLLLTQAFAGMHPDLGETRAVVIVQGGRIVVERYGDGYSRDTRLISWSMAKSFTGALVGAAVLQNRVNIDAPMGNPNWRAGDPRGAIPWRIWMQMTDGQPWSEMHATGVNDNDSARMLFGEGRADTAKFGATRRLIHEPGTVWITIPVASP